MADPAPPGPRPAARPEGTRREKLYGEFIDEAAKLFADALGHSLDDASKLVPLHAIFGRLWLFASDEVVRSADAVLHRIVKRYYSPNEDFHDRRIINENLDLLWEFTSICRNDLKG